MTSNADGTLWYAPFLSEYKVDDGRKQVTDPEDANLVSSRRQDGRHNIQIDLDTPHEYSPSSTAGHGHLTIRVGTTWEKYEALLRALHACGAIETGYMELALERKATFLRPPNVRKTDYAGAKARLRRHEVKASRQELLEIVEMLS